MDDFRIYSKGLSITEITDLYGDGDGDFGVHPYEEFPPEFDNIPEVIIPESPVVYWTFNELNGTEVRDDSGLENHGYVENNTSTPDLFFHSEPGRNGSAIRFDGGETIVLEQDVTTFNVSGPFSLCIWLKSADLNAQIINSGRFAINVSDGFLWGQVQVGGSYQANRIYSPTRRRMVSSHPSLGWEINFASIKTTKKSHLRLIQVEI